MEAAAYSLSELVKALKEDQCTTLHACENQIGDHGSMQVALALGQNSSVITLRLNDNHIGDLELGFWPKHFRKIDVCRHYRSRETGLVQAELLTWLSS